MSYQAILRSLFSLVVTVVGISCLPATADAALYPIQGHSNISSTSALRAAMQARPDIAAKLVAQTGGGKLDRKQWTYCGAVSASQRAQLVRDGAKNTAYDANGKEVVLGTIKSGALIWACRVDTEAIKRELKRELGSSVKLKCTTHTTKAGAVTVTCTGAKRTYRVKPPLKRVPIGKDCFNRQTTEGQTTDESLISSLWTAWSTVRVKKGKTIVCPNGATATATASAMARGFGYGRTMQAAKAMAKANAKASVSVSVGCGEVTPPPLPPCEVTGTCPPPPPPGDVCPNIPGTQTVPAGYYVDASGNCVKPRFHAVADATATATATCPDGTVARSSATGHGEAWSDVSQADANREAKAIADAQAKANADASVACGSTPPPPPVDHPPVVNIMGSPAHLYVGGNAYVWIEASDSDGDAVLVKVSAAGSGTVAGLVPSAVRWDGTPCPSGKSCYRATAWAGSFDGNMTVTATVTAGGKSDSDSATFPVKPDDFG